MECRKKYLEEHGTNSYSHNTESNPFASKIVCGLCNRVFARKGWQSKRGEIRRIWQCGERYKLKGVLGCGNRHVEESTLEAGKEEMMKASEDSFLCNYRVMEQLFKKYQKKVRLT